MRIRKRQPLFSSSFSSDPHRSPLLVQLADAQPLPPIGSDDDPSGIGERSKQEPLEEKVEDVRGQQERRESGEKGNHTRKGCILDSQMQLDNFPPSSTPPSTQDGRWYDGEKTIPLKKRRGSFENNNNVAASDDSKKIVKARMKTKMNKKCSSATQNDDDHVDQHVDKKKATRGSALMEGSRCSRVNGRGWRCCQPTLVGYSLCEHHLGKGRLRSMASVRNRSMKKVQDLPEPCGDNSSPSSSSEKQTTQFAADYPLGKSEKKAAVVTKKRMKLGMVKARSMSSLMGQTNTQVAVAADYENNK